MCGIADETTHAIHGINAFPAFLAHLSCHRKRRRQGQYVLTFKAHRKCPKHPNIVIPANHSQHEGL